MRTQSPTWNQPGEALEERVFGLPDVLQSAGLTLNQVNTVFRMGISPGHSLKDCFVYMAAYPGKVFEKLPLASGLRAGQWFDFSFDQVVLEIFIFSKSCYNFVFFQVFQISNFVIKIVFYFPD